MYLLHQHAAYNFVLVNKTSEQLSVKIERFDQFIKMFEPNSFFSGTVSYGEVWYSFAKITSVSRYSCIY